MKRVYISIAALLLCGQMTFAQTPANRTASTIAADVLAQMPAAEQERYNKVLKELSESGEGAVLELVKMINAPGKGSNASVDYALSGLSHFVMAKGLENERLAISKAYMKALDMTSERETKAFLLRQLQMVGQDECIEKISSYLHDKELSGPAARVLCAISSDASGKALIAALKQRMGTPDTQKNIILAIAESKVQDAEDILRSMLGSSDPDVQKVVLYALSQVGTETSLKDLAAAAAAVNYQMERTGANESYIILIKRLAADPSTKAVAEKAANDLLKKATKANQTHSREAALQIQLGLSEEPTKLLVKALKDPCKKYRNAALALASNYADNTMYIEVGKLLAKSKSEVKVDIINWFGREAKCPQKHDLVRDLEIRFDLPFSQLLTQQLQDKEYAVKEAAVWTMLKIGDKVYIPTIANLLTDADKQVVLLAQDALFAFPGDIDNAVAKSIASATDNGKVAVLELLARRKATSKINTVLDQADKGSASVKKAAYIALKDVVGEADLTNMCGRLETAATENIANLQDAVISSLSSMPSVKQVETIIRRMYQAGDKKYLYYKVLASTGEPKVLDIIEKGYAEGSGAAKEAAFEALLAWNGLESADILFAISKEKGTATEAGKRVLGRYVQLVSNPALSGENRLIRLRKAMEIAKADDQRVAIMKQIEKTGTFLAVMYAGEFLNDKAVRQAAANVVMNVTISNNFAGKNIRALLEKVVEVYKQPEAHPDAIYHRESIAKYLGEMPDCEGFVSMFNGKDLTGWKGLVKNPIERAKMKPAQLEKEQQKADEQMRQDWKVEDGMLVFVGSGYDNLCTEKQYGDFEMYVDWMLDPAGPEADAGIYLRGTPQVQIWDTSRVNVGAQVGSGGLYNNKENKSTPIKVADNKLGEWNSFYIKMVGDRVTVLLNGEKVVDDVIMENYWDRKSPIFPIEQIELQAHGSKVYYRNLYIKELERTEPFQLSEQEKKEGYKILFDGTNMHEWTGNTVDYTIQDGVISMDPTRSFGGNLYTKDEYADFVFRFEFQLTPGANNGVGIRTPMEGDAAYVGMEVQILDCEHPIYKNITKLQHHGSVYGIIAAKEDHHDAFKPVGEWNEEEIYAKGDYIRVTVNGVVITEGNIREATKNGTPDKKEHPGLFNKKGHIGFLGHGSPLKFRNIRIRELK